MSEQKKIADLLAKVHTTAGDGDYVFRGENDDEEYEEVSSRIYRIYKNTLKKQPDLTANAMQDLVLQDVKRYIDFEDDLDILAELQHYDGDTNLIDFSHDYLIALFFACAGDDKINDNGRLILLPKNHPGITEPKKNQNNRIIFQRSVFVKQESGYIPKGEYESIPILANLKRPILDYLKRWHNIGMETIYGDLLGYVKNKRTYHQAYISFQEGVIHDKNKEYKKAIAAFDESIKLKPDYVDAYSNRAVAKENVQDYKGALKDHTRLIELRPNDAELYVNRGLSYVKVDEYENAYEDFNEAIKSDGEHAGAYFMRGLHKRYILSDVAGSKSDMQKSWNLAKRQNDEELISLIQEEIEELSLIIDAP